jgi:hypothetical protein
VTEIKGALMHIDAQLLRGVGVRQLFLLMDGDVLTPDEVLTLARDNAAANRCSAIGIGRGADAGSSRGLRIGLVGERPSLVRLTTSRGG